MATSQAGSYVALEMTERKRASEGDIGGNLDEVFWLKVNDLLIFYIQI